jgi:hypothetical protein
VQCEVHNGKVGEMPLGAVFNRLRKIEKSDYYVVHPFVIYERQWRKRTVTNNYVYISYSIYFTVA